MSSRHLSRSIAMQSLYEWDFDGKKQDISQIIERNIGKFGPGIKDKSFARKLVFGVLEKLSEIDNVIKKAAPQWPIEQISVINRNVLRLGLYELLYSDEAEVPPKVAINEAIELAKSFGGVSSGKFINGVLGAVYKEMREMRGAEKLDGKKNLPEEILVGGLPYCEKDNKIQVALILDVFGYWTLPKGHVEEGETLTQALRREIKEETGIEGIRIVKKLGLREYIANDPDKGKIKRKVTDFLVEALGKTELKLEEGGGIKDVRWFNLEQVLDLRRYQDSDAMFRSVISGLSKSAVLKKEKEPFAAQKS